MQLHTVQEMKTNYLQHFCKLVNSYQLFVTEERGLRSDEEAKQFEKSQLYLSELLHSHSLAVQNHTPSEIKAMLQ